MHVGCTSGGRGLCPAGPSDGRTHDWFLFGIDSSSPHRKFLRRRGLGRTWAHAQCVMQREQSGGGDKETAPTPKAKVCRVTPCQQQRASLESAQTMLSPRLTGDAGAGWQVPGRPAEGGVATSGIVNTTANAMMGAQRVLWVWEEVKI